MVDAPLQESRLQRLPLPLAQLLRRAHNAKTSVERHLAALTIWEAGIKLLGAVTLTRFAGRPESDPELVRRLQNLTRPTLDHWWEFVRRLVPVLADQDDVAFVQIRDLLLGRAREDFPHAAHLDGVLTEDPNGRAAHGAAVRMSELFDRLVRHRDEEIAHGHLSQRPIGFYERLGDALLSGAEEVFARLDVLAGKHLVYVSEVRQSTGEWLIERYELIGPNARRIESMEVPQEEADRLPQTQRLYLDDRTLHAPPSTLHPPRSTLHPLHPLLLYEPETEEVLFLSARRGRQHAEYLCYTTGRTVDRPDLASERNDFLGKILGMTVVEEQVATWANRSEAEEHCDDMPSAPARRVLGEFELISELGRGGMGIVYRARQPSLGRQVALKSLVRAGDERAQARFRREIRALGRVEHPHLVRIFTSGADGDHWFYVMELVEGVSLAAMCDRLRARSESVSAVDVPTFAEEVRRACAEQRRQERSLSADNPPRGSVSGRRDPFIASGDTLSDSTPRPDRGYVRVIVTLLKQAAEAAHALHEAGIVHRDVKPGNIMVTADGQQAVLMDLGLAQLADDDEGRLTRTRQFVGTLRYASPQQVLSVERLDRRTDVYSLGATLWELLTLRRLYGVTEQTPTPKLMEQIQREEPERVQTYHPGISKDLDAVVLKCLEKDPKRRYATAAELARDLGRYLAGVPVKARPVSGVTRAWRWVRRNPVVSSLATLFVLALLLGMAFSSVFAVRAMREAERADTQADDARRHAQAAFEARGAAEHEARLARREAYYANMLLVQNAWEQSPVPHFLNLLERQRPRSGQEDLRGFEWHYWKKLIQRGHTTIKTGRWLKCVAFSPDGKRLASTSDRGIVNVWDTASRQLCLALKGHQGRVYCVAFSPDGKYLASSGNEGTVKVWDVVTGRDAFTFKGHAGTAAGVAFSPDGKWLASASHDRTVKLWDLARGRETLTFTGHSGMVASVAFSPDGKHVASGGNDNTVRIWERLTGREHVTFRRHTSEVHCVAYSPDGKRLAAAGQGELWVFNAVTGADAILLKGHRRHAESVAFSPDGKRLASVSFDGTAKLWDPATGQELQTFKAHTNTLYGVAYSPDGRSVASAGADGTIRIWNAINGQAPLTLNGHASWVYGVTFSPDGERLASASDDQTVKVWDAARSREVLTLRGHNGTVRAVTFSLDGKRLASASHDETVKIWDPGSGRELLCLQGHTRPVYCVVFSPDGERLATASEDGTVKIWDGTNGRILRTLTGHNGPVYTVAFSRDAKWLAAGGQDGRELSPGTVEVWDAGTGQLAFTLKGHTSPVMCVAFSPDGARLASSSADMTIKVWDFASRREVFTLSGHAARVENIAYSPDGKRLASASIDGIVKLWDAGTGQEALTLNGHTNQVLSLSFSPDGKRLASASADKSIKLWDANSGEW